MNNFKKLFSNSNGNVIGMIHTLPLPGSPRFDGDMNKIVNLARKEAELYVKYNIDGLIVENMHDIPYLHYKNLGPETTAAMARVCAAVREIVPACIPVGLQILAGGNCEAVAVAKSTGCNFIRAEGFVFGHVADEGYMDACAGSLLRYRSNIKADDVYIYTDIKKKHSSHAITNDLNIVEVSKAAEFFLSDGVIVTGTCTGIAADIQELTEVKNAINIPTLIGSGVTLDNIEHYLCADAVIVGSHFKYDGKWENTVEEARIAKFMEKIKNLRSK